MYLLPQEVEVWYIIPAVRKEFARLLVKEHGMTYEKAGNILGISKAAVSQYLANKRATKVKLDEKVKNKIKRATKRIIKEPREIISEFQEILKFMKKTKCSCEICKKYNKGVLDYCNCKPKYS